MMLVDSHCHIDCIDLEKDFSGNLDNLMDEAKNHHVSHMLLVSIEKENYSRIKAIANQYDNVFHSYGVHPNVEMTSDITIDDLIEHGSEKKCIAIGETGLDYFRSSGCLNWQRQRFRNHIKAANQLQKPLIIHMREATDDTLAILKEEKAHAGVMHCFAEDWPVAKKALDLGFYISLAGIVTFKNAHALKEVAKNVPIDRLLVETDSPYLAPMPHRGKQNRPAWVKYVAEYVANLRGVTLEDIAAHTTDNFFQLFKNATRC